MGQQSKVQNAGLRIITGGMKTTPISEVEIKAGFRSLEERREEKLLCQKGKMKRLSSHPLHSKLQQKHRTPSSELKQPLEMLQDFEHLQAETPTIILDIPGIHAKEHHTDEELRSLTLEALSVAYPSTNWARAYADGSAKEAAKQWRRWNVHQVSERHMLQEV